MADGYVLVVQGPAALVADEMLLTCDLPEVLLLGELETVWPFFFCPFDGNVEGRGRMNRAERQPSRKKAKKC